MAHLGCQEESGRKRVPRFSSMAFRLADTTSRCGRGAVSPRLPHPGGNNSPGIRTARMLRSYCWCWSCVSRVEGAREGAIGLELEQDPENGDR
jgi:hypothetical protein